MSKAKRRLQKERGKSIIIAAVIFLLINVLTIMTVGLLNVTGVISIENGILLLNNKADAKIDVSVFKMPDNSDVTARAQAVINYYLTDKMSDYEKVKILHDWIIEWTTYATENQENSIMYSADAVFKVGYAVPDGYAAAFKLLCDLINVQCEVVDGELAETGEIHTWNMVKLSNEWYHVDISLNDILTEELDSGEILYDYFLVNDEIMVESHFWDRLEYPTCFGTKYLLKGYKGRVLKTMLGIDSVIRKSYASGNNSATIVYTGVGMPDLSSLNELVPGYEIFNRDIGKYKRITIKFNRDYTE